MNDITKQRIRNAIRRELVHPTCICARLAELAAAGIALPIRCKAHVVRWRPTIKTP